MIFDKFSLKGKAAIVTGAGRGIGKAMALALAEAGSDVVVVSRTLSELEKVSEQIRSLNRKSVVCQADVTKSEEREKIVQKAIQELGRIDILVNNAGTNIRKLAIDLSEPEWDLILNTNLKAPFFCAQAVAKEMAKKNNGGTIINISSLRSAVAPPCAPAYTASKGGISMLTKALAVEWAPYKIRVNAIAPGYVETELTSHFKEKEKDLYDAICEQTVFKRWAQPEEMTGMLIYLTSDASQYMTGQTVYVEGGFLLT